MITAFNCEEISEDYVTRKNRDLEMKQAVVISAVRPQTYLEQPAQVLLLRLINHGQDSGDALSDKASEK